METRHKKERKKGARGDENSQNTKQEIINDRHVEDQNERLRPKVMKTADKKE